MIYINTIISIFNG